MSEHPIKEIMSISMEKIKEMVDVNTIIGDTIQVSNNTVIIPVSKVSFGFAAGGSEFKGETIDEYSKIDKEEQIQYRLPFGGGTGAGVTVSPIAFLIVEQNGVKLLSVDHNNTFDKVLDYMPELLEKANNLVNKCFQNKKELKEKIVDEIIKDGEENKN